MALFILPVLTHHLLKSTMISHHAWWALEAGTVKGNPCPKIISTDTPAPQFDLTWSYTVLSASSTLSRHRRPSARENSSPVNPRPWGLKYVCPHVGLVVSTSCLYVCQFHLWEKVLSVNHPDFRNKIDIVIQVSVFRWDSVVISRGTAVGVQWKLSSLCVNSWWWGAKGWYIGCHRSIVGSFRVAVGSACVVVGSSGIVVGVCVCVWKRSSIWEPYNCGVWWQRPNHSRIIVSVCEIQVFWGQLDNCRVKVDAWIDWWVFVVVEGELDPNITVLEFKV